MFFAKVNKSCLITYLGVFFGVLAMYFAFAKMTFSESVVIRYSLACLVISGVCDMFDGKFARACKRTEEEKAFGIQLDSLADTFCFLAVPVVFMLSLGIVSVPATIIYALFILCGISRLGYFNVRADLDNAVKSYQGLPVTTTAIIYPLIGLLHNYVSLTVFKNIYLVTTAVVAVLMVLGIKIPKLTGVWYKIIPILAVILVTILLVF